MPATLSFDAHRVELAVPSFFTSPVQPAEQERRLITMARALV